MSKRFETSLASSLSAAGASFTTVSATDDDGNALSGLYALSIDVGNADVEDVIATVSGTTWTIVYRGIDADAPNTEVSGNKKAHRRGAPVVITDYPIMAILRNILNGDDTAPNHLKYASNTSFTDDEELISKRYADGLANTGAANSTTTVQGLVEEATQAEVEAGTATGGTGAKLFAPLDKNGAKLFFGYAADAGANDTYAITCSPVPTAYTTGMLIQFKANTVNTGACTINVNTLGAKSLKVNKDLDPQDGYIKAGQDVLIQYDGTNFQILSVSGKPSVSQSGEEIYAASTSGNDTYVITVAPVPAAYATGMRFYFKPDTGNTGAATLNVNSLGAKSIFRSDGSALATGDIVASQIVHVGYDGTQFLMLSPVAQPSIASLVPYPNGGFSTIGTMSVDTNTTAKVGAFLITQPTLISNISINVTAVSASGTLKFAIFDKDGFTPQGSVTTATISGTGIVTTAVTPFTLYPGYYYFVILPVSTASITISSWTNIALAYSVTPALGGTYTVTASTMPSTLTIGSISAAGGTGAVFRIT